MAANPVPRHKTKRSTYVLVFLLLAVVTAIEVGLSTVGLAAQTSTALFLALSLIKAALVAAFFMHLKDDARLFRYILILPTILLIIFVFLTVPS